MRRLFSSLWKPAAKSRRLMAAISWLPSCAPSTVSAVLLAQWRLLWPCWSLGPGGSCTHARCGLWVNRYVVALRIAPGGGIPGLHVRHPCGSQESYLARANRLPIRAAISAPVSAGSLREEVDRPVSVVAAPAALEADLPPESYAVPYWHHPPGSVRRKPFRAFPGSLGKTVPDC